MADLSKPQFAYVGDITRATQSSPAFEEARDAAAAALRHFIRDLRTASGSDHATCFNTALTAIAYVYGAPVHPRANSDAAQDHLGAVLSAAIEKVRDSFGMNPAQGYVKYELAMG